MWISVEQILAMHVLYGCSPIRHLAVGEYGNVHVHMCIYPILVALVAQGFIRALQKGLYGSGAAVQTPFQHLVQVFL